jgi:hypothetical protein
MQVGVEIYLTMKMEQTVCSETSAYKIQTQGDYPEENIKQLNARHNNEKEWDYVSCCYFREPLCRHTFHMERKYLPLWWCSRHAYITAFRIEWFRVAQHKMTIKNSEVRNDLQET